MPQPTKGSLRNYVMHQQSLLGLRPLRQALSITAAACLLAACGGGGGTVSVSVPPTTVTFTGNVTTTGGAPVPNALVSIGTTPTTSDNNGNYSLTLDTTAVNTNTAVVVVVAKDGYQTCTGTVNVAAGTVAGCNQLTASSQGELYPAAADAELVRLGDGEVTGGASNSKLQLKTPYGLTKTITLVWPANFTPAGFQTFTVNVRMRGLQASICADKIRLLQGASAATAAVVQDFSATTGTLADSDASGEFSAYALQVPVVLLNASGGNLHVKLESGVCTSGTPADPSDDYEIVGVNGKFS